MIRSIGREGKGAPDPFRGGSRKDQDIAMEIREALLLGALLHDIGKLYRRAFSGRIDGLPPFEGEGDPVHLRFTHRFIQSLVPERFRGCLPFALRHARPSDRLEAIVHLADRACGGVVVDDRVEGGWLRSMLAPPSEGGEGFVIPPRVRTGRKDFFPMTVVGRQAYGVLWQGLCRDLEGPAKEEAFGRYFDALVTLLEKYTATIPASVPEGGVDSLPLFDHLRSTAACADAFYRYAMEQGWTEGIVGEPLDDVVEAWWREPALSLLLVRVECDPGFSFPETDAHDARAFQKIASRHLCLDLLRESVATQVEGRLGLTRAARIWTAGEEFAWIVPNLSGIPDRIVELAGCLGRGFLRSWQGRIGFALGRGAASLEGLSRGVPRLYAQARRDLERNRLRIFAEALHGPEELHFPLGGGEEMEFSIELDRDRSGVFLRFEGDRSASGGGDFASLSLGARDGISWRSGGGEVSGAAGRLLLNTTKSERHMGIPTTFLFRPYAVPDRSPAQLAELAGVHLRGRTPVSHHLPRFALLRLEIEGVAEICAETPGTIAHRSALLGEIASFFPSLVSHVQRICLLPVAGEGYGVWVIGPWREVLDEACRIHDRWERFCGRGDLVLKGGGGIFAPETSLGAAAAVVAKRTEESARGLCFAEGEVSWENLERVIALGDRLADAVCRLGYRRLPRNFLAELNELWHRKSHPKTLPRFLHAVVRSTPDAAISRLLLEELPAFFDDALIPLLVTYTTLSTGRLRPVPAEIRREPRGRRRTE
ncbi:MAG: hypothetical protein D6795_00335 [Deltaproteobacteria bacterium]|nr:MAG: hypothetical protein D6795_00335 [Deltaproteobacteria bacterium]